MLVPVSGKTGHSVTMVAGLDRADAQIVCFLTVSMSDVT
jgi:hypothetical protein